jgi:hypothetical protein
MNYNYKYNEIKNKYINLKILIGGMNINIIDTIDKNKSNIEKTIDIDTLKNEVNYIKTTFESDLVTKNVLLLEYNKVILLLSKEPFIKADYEIAKTNYEKKKNYFVKFKKAVNTTNQTIKPMKLTQIKSKDECIAVKDSTIIDKNSPGYLGDLGDNLSKQITLNNNCGDVYDINNKSWCYFFVSLKCELIKLVKDNQQIEATLKNILGLRNEWDHINMLFH